MCFFISLIPATFWLVIGYVVLFLSSKTHGQLRSFGRVLAIWVFVIAAFVPMMGSVVSFGGYCPIAEIMEQMHEQ